MKLRNVMLGIAACAAGALLATGCAGPAGAGTDGRPAAGQQAPSCAVGEGKTVDAPAKGPFPVMKTDDEWLALLTPDQFRVLRQHGTERAFTGALLHNKEEGTYRCAACGQELFASQSKFDSGSGWPSFFEPIAQGVVGTRADTSFGMTRIEVHCARCGGHLGHVFDDGPAPTGQRFCMNSASLAFDKKKK